MLIRISNLMDRTLCKNDIEKLPDIVVDAIDEKIQILSDSYGKYFESAFGSAEIYIFTDDGSDEKQMIQDILAFYSIDPNVDVPEYSDMIGDNNLLNEPIYTETLWLLANGEKPVLIISCEGGTNGTV